MYKTFRRALWIVLPALILACNRQEKAGAPPTPAGDPTIEALNTRIGQEPANASLYARRATLYYEKKGYDEAIQDLTRALSLDSLNVDYHHLLADVYMDYFRSRLALRTMERAAALYPERIPTLLKLARFQLTLKQQEASLQTVDRILRLDPRNADAYFLMGMNFRELGDLNRAINSFQTAVEIEPELTDAWINLGQLHARIEGALAARFFDNAIKTDPTSITALHAKADFLRDKDDLQEAIALYQAAGRIDPRYGEAYFNAGLLYMELDSLPQAYRQFDLAIQADPLYIKAYAFRGLAAEKLGNNPQARADYEQALRLSPDYELARNGLARVQGQ